MAGPAIVTAIERLDGRRRRVVVDGEPFAIVSLDVVRETTLSEGDSWDPDDLRTALLRASFPCARTRALRLASVKDRSSAQLRDRLLREGLPVEAVDEAVATLRASGVVDDARWACSTVTRRASRGYGRLRIEAELKRAGIPTEVSAPALEESVPEDAEPSRALEAARLLAARLRDPDRLATALVGRGFPPSTALSSARDVLFAEEAPESP